MPDAEAILTGLDDEQRAVALATSGPVVVLAGAGTGKTRAITHRIAFGVASGAHDPRRTLAVTFTNRAAGEMRSRLQGLGAGSIAVRTFHAAALRQLRYFWPRMSGQEFPELIASKARYVAEAAAACGLSTDTAVVRDLSSDIEYAKSTERTSRDVVANPGRREWSMDVGDIARVIEEYEQVKVRRGLLDFEDVLLVMVGALQSRPDIADEVRAAYRWFTVDEYQDVNPLQRRLLDLWRGDGDELCVVGDVSQTIYSFTGASPTYLLDFAREFPGATQVRLVTSYRSTEPIVSLANSVIAQAPTEATIRLRSVRGPGATPQIDVYDDDVDEANAVAGHITALIRSGVRARDIAVLFRINAQSADLEESLASVAVPVSVRGAERFFDRGEVREAITRLRGAARAGASGSLVDEVQAVLGATGWQPSPPRGAGAVRERWESLSALATLAGEHPDLDLSAFVAELDRRAEAQHAPAAEAVTLSSLHAAKGLEWEHVFIVGCSEGLLPFQRGDAGDDDVDEERRLLYVGITRARTDVRLSWARARQPGGRANRSASRFLTSADPLVLSGARSEVVTGTRRAQRERRRGGPARCRLCGKGLVTPEERTLGRCRTCPVELDLDRWEQMRAWRLDQAREQGVPAYRIFTDATLTAIVERRPASLDELADIPGVGPAKLEAYGPTILALLLD